MENNKKMNSWNPWKDEKPSVVTKMYVIYRDGKIKLCLAF